jgi:hypothetical protein
MPPAAGAVAATADAQRPPCNASSDYTGYVTPQGFHVPLNEVADALSDITSGSQGIGKTEPRGLDAVDGVTFGVEVGILFLA